MAPGDHRTTHPAYLDYAASAPLRPEVVEAMAPWLDAGHVGNPSSIHQAGRQARIGVEDARDLVAQALGVHPLEVLFTSGATEANNMAIWGALAEHPNAHVIAGSTDHPSITQPLDYAQQTGRAQVSIIDPARVDSSRCGRIESDAVLKAVNEDTQLLIGTKVTSEMGVIQPISDWFDALDECHPDFLTTKWAHVDATQALGRVDIRPLAKRYTSMALSAHKVGGPQGVGVLALHRAKQLISPILGGGQERGIRSGTIPVALVVGAAQAIVSATQHREQEEERLRALSKRLREGLAGTDWTPTVAARHHVPDIVHITAPDTDTEPMVMALDRAGVYVSAGTACQSGALRDSILVQAIGIPGSSATLRLSFGWATTQADIDQAITALREIPTGGRPTGNMGVCVF